MRYLGIDYGFKKIGLAISEGTIASPLTVLHVSSKLAAINLLKDAIQKEKVEVVVIGMPESGQIKAAIQSVVADLLKNVKAEIITTHETLSSKKAKEEMLLMGINKKKRIEEDAYSAARILQDFLDEQKPNLR